MDQYCNPATYTTDARVELARGRIGSSGRGVTASPSRSTNTPLDLAGSSFRHPQGQALRGHPVVDQLDHDAVGFRLQTATADHGPVFEPSLAGDAEKENTLAATSQGPAAGPDADSAERSVGSASSEDGSGARYRT